MVSKEGGEVGARRESDSSGGEIDVLIKSKRENSFGLFLSSAVVYYAGRHLSCRRCTHAIPTSNENL